MTCPLDILACRSAICSSPLPDRRRLHQLLERKFPIAEIARQLRRHRSTFYRELKRNTFHDAEFPEYSGYYGGIAQRHLQGASATAAQARPVLACAPIGDRADHAWLVATADRRPLRLERHPICVSYETIYKFAYSTDGQAIKLWRHLPERRARRRPRHARRRHGRRFSPELNILHRPDTVAERKQFRH